MRLIKFALAALALTVGLAGADTTRKIPIKELEKLGVYSRNFSVYHVSEDGRTILAADEPPFTVKRKGVMHRLWLFRLDSDLKIVESRSFDLSVPRIEQANFAPDFKSVLLSSRRGSDIHRLDLSTGEVVPFSSHQPGQPGFRIHSDILSLYQGKLYTIGYFYDAEDFAGPEQMVEIDTGKSGKEAFTPVVEMDPIHKALTGLRTASTLSPAGMFFYCQDPADASHWVVQRWTNALGLQKLDEGVKVEGSWGEGPLAAYCIRRSGGSHEVVLANGVTGDKTVVNSGSEPMVNPCLSKDGNTLVVAQVTGPDQSDYWVGQEGDQFKLRPLIQKMPACTIRIAHNGTVVCLYQGVEGLTLIKLDSK